MTNRESLTEEEHDEADCEICDGKGEITAVDLNEHGEQPCPSCISRECAQLRAECATKAIEIERLRDELKQLRIDHRKEMNQAARDSMQDIAEAAANARLDALEEGRDY